MSKRSTLNVVARFCEAENETNNRDCKAMLLTGFGIIVGNIASEQFDAHFAPDSDDGNNALIVTNARVYRCGLNSDYTEIKLLFVFLDGIQSIAAIDVKQLNSTQDFNSNDVEHQDDSQYVYRDELIDQAIDILFQEKQISASMLQRKMRIGYARACKIMDVLAERGFITKASSFSET